MPIHRLCAILVLGLAAGCAGESATKPVEMLDQRTGMTLAALKEPIQLVPSALNVALTIGKRTSFAYVGPVEWNRMGTIGYGLWIHIAPGTDHQAVDIRSPGAVTLFLDDGPLVLSPVEMPKLGSEPYTAVVSWGQTAYYDLNVGMLRKMASSQKFELDVRATDDSTLTFFPGHDTRPTLTDYMHGRGITDD